MCRCCCCCCWCRTATGCKGGLGSCWFFRCLCGEGLTSLVKGDRVLSGLGGGTGVPLLLTAFPGEEAPSLDAPGNPADRRGSRSVLAGRIGGRDTVAWMASSRGRWSLRGGGGGGGDGSSAEALKVVAGGSGIGRGGTWGPFCISPSERQEEGRARLCAHLSHLRFGLWNTNLLGFGLIFIFSSCQRGARRGRSCAFCPPLTQ